MAWQEYLTQELARAAKSKKQDELRRVLKDASEHGMLPSEKPVWQALEVFVDPPTVVYQPPAQMWPDASGKVVLRVNIRSADSIAWYKNGILLKEGADSGRVTGVATNQLSFKKLLGKDKNAKVWAKGKNKWGVVETAKCELMLPGMGGPLKSAGMVAVVLSGKESKNLPAAPPPPAAIGDGQAIDMAEEIKEANKSFLSGRKFRGMSITRSRNSSKQDNSTHSRNISNSLSTARRSPSDSISGIAERPVVGADL